MSPEAEPHFHFANPPAGGFWRVARADDPLLPSYLDPDDEDLANGGNRFDSTGYGTVYFATGLAGCFAETLARYRVKASIRAVLENDGDWLSRGFMPPGSVPADWRHRRLAVRTLAGDGARFLDAEAPETHVVLTSELAEELAELGYDYLDVGIVRGRDRRVTRLIAEWAFTARETSGEPAFAGVRYMSRHGNFECWAVFDRASITELERRAITLGMTGFRETAKRFGLTVY